jgi:hypothetical protein
MTTTTTTNIFTSIRQEEEFKLERKRLLRRLLLDESKSTIERTKARVELALLTSDAHIIHGEGDDDDDDAIKKKISNLLLLNDEELHSLVGVVSRTAAERERDIERHAERHRREEVILRLEAQLKEQGAVKSEERRQRLEKELAEAVSDMEKWEKDEDIRMVGEVEMDELPGVEVAKMALSSPPSRQTSNINEEDEGGNDEEDNHDSFEAQLDSFSHPIIPASFYKSSPSLVGEVGEIIDPPTNRIKEISTSMQTTETEETSDGNASVCSHSTASTVERDNGCTRSSSHPPVVVDDEITRPSSSSPTTASLEHQVQMLLKEAALREESMQLMAMELERSERRNEKRIAKLKNQVSKLAKENGEYPEQLQYWKQKSLAFSRKIYELELELDEKEDEVEDLLDYKQIQDDKVELLGIEIEKLNLELRKKDRLIALDRAEETCDKLMIPPKRDITRRASEPLATDSSHSDDTEETATLDDSFVKDEENRIDILALESKVSHFAKEKSRMEAELEEMRQLLAETNARAVEREGRDEISKKSERIIFQVSCKKCPKGKNCSVVGVTTGDLKMKMRRLTKKCVVAAAECPQKTTPSSFLGGLLNNHHRTSSAAHSAISENKETPSSTASTEDKDILKQKEVFIKHLASHIPKKMVKNEKEARSFCKKLIRVEVLKKVGGEELYWEDNV